MPQQDANDEETSENGPGIAGTALNFLVELVGEELLELGLLLLCLLVATFWKQLLIVLGGALLITGIIAGFVDYSAGNRPRSLFSCENEKQSGKEKNAGIQNL